MPARGIGTVFAGSVTVPPLLAKVPCMKSEDKMLSERSSTMRRLNLILFAIVVALVIFSLVRSVFGTPPQRVTPGLQQQTPMNDSPALKSSTRLMLVNSRYGYQGHLITSGCPENGIEKTCIGNNSVTIMFET